MWDKIKGLLNPMKWLEAKMGGVIIEKVVKRGIQGATSALVGFIFAPKVMPYLQPIFEVAGWEFTPEKIQAALAAVLGGVVLAILNVLKAKLKINIPTVL